MYQSNMGLIDREGNYYPCGFGDHERLATKLVSDLELYKEFSVWEENREDKTQLDFLYHVKFWGTRSNAECMGTDFQCEKPNQVMLTKNEEIEFYYNKEALV